MTLRDFLNSSKVKSYEICLIYAHYSTVAISWIFEESSSAIPEKIPKLDSERRRMGGARGHKKRWFATTHMVS